MSRLPLLLAACLAALALTAPEAEAGFGVFGFDTTFIEEGIGGEEGPMATQAGSHPFALTTSLGLNFGEEEIGPGEVALFTEGRLKDLRLEQVPGLIADTTAYPRCSSLDFLQGAACPAATQVGVTASSTDLGGWRSSPVYNLTPPPGVLLRIGWSVHEEANIVIDAGLNPQPPYDGLVDLRNAPQTLDVIGSKTQLWGDPASHAHDPFRAACLKEEASESFPRQDIEGFRFESKGVSKACEEVPANPKPFLTLPTRCGQALPTSFQATSWNGESATGSRLTHDAAGEPQGFTGCGALPTFDPSISATPTARAASSPSGLDFSLQIADEGLTSLGGRAKSHIRQAIVTLPEGMTANPSVAEGLAVCSEADLSRETLSSAPGAGCPEASKIGTLEVESPVAPEPVKGALYQATPYANLAEDSLIAFYIVLKNPKLGIIVEQPVKVEADPKTGQLRAITDEIPQVPFSSFRLHFREGGRSPLVTPPTCGEHQVSATLVPWSGQAPVDSVSSFQIVSGPNGAPCPSGAPPFDPGFEAGSDNNAAGSFSPFSMRLTRRDGDQDLVRFDTTLPPGVGGILAGLEKCSDVQISLAKTKTGREELDTPSCPAGSKIGSVLGGAGVGSQLTYARGSIYLAGPFGGAPLSVVGILPAVAGPFDVGTVVSRFALNVDPRTAQVSVDGGHSDPIPHILKGIPLVVRDIQVHVDRPAFTYDPTSCNPFSVRASIWGGGADPFSLADDSPVARQARYQAANCARLGFRPHLSLDLKGGVFRGAHPAFQGVLRPRPGDANIAATVVRLPRSAFLDQAHIRTICTRVQYAAKACPPGSVYGHVRAFTPVLSEPLEGPVYLRSSNHNLPDLVFSLHGVVDFEAVGRIDSKHGGIRVSFNQVPDAPISKVLIAMQGGKKGLIINSTNLCAAPHHAHVRFDAHSAKRLTIAPVLQADCAKRRGHRRR